MWQSYFKLFVVLNQVSDTRNSLFIQGDTKVRYILSGCHRGWVGWGVVNSQQPEDPYSGFENYMSYQLHIIMQTEKSPDSRILLLAMDDFIKAKVGQGNL